MIYVISENSLHAFVAATRMADLLAIERNDFMKEVVWITLLQPGSDPHKYIEMIDRASTPEDAIVLIGRTVARHYGMETLGPLAAARRHGGMGSTVVSFPDPVGPNRWWNKADNIKKASLTMQRVWADHR